MIVIDFETRSRADLKKVGTWVYSTDPSTEILCMAFSRGGEVQIWHPEMHFQAHEHLMQWFDRLIRDGELLYAHNAFFERCIWQNVAVPKYGFPPIPDSAWRCTLAACSRLGLPRSLEDAGKALGLPIQKDLDGRKLMLKLCKPDKSGEFPGSPAEFARLRDYCVQDVKTELAVHYAIQDLTPSELKVWQLDQQINLRGVPVDREALTHALAIADKCKEQAADRLSDLTDGAVNTPQQVEALLTWLEANGLELANLSAATVTEALKGDLPEDVRTALQLRQDAGKASTAKLQSMSDQAGDDDRVRGTVLYHGAATGRWAGSGIQIQNFPRGILSESEIEVVHRLLPDEDPQALDLLLAPPLHCLSSALRSFIRAEKGQRFLVCDFAGIEARVLAWVANQDDLVEAFREKSDVYKTMAGEIYGVEAKDVTKPQRQMGKQAVLGCIAEGVEVLTRTGWTPIEKVRLGDLLWDGEEWVSHSGVIEKGLKPVVSVSGVLMTEDHEVLTEEGWKEAWELEGNGRYLRSARCLATGQLPDSEKAFAGDLWQSTANVAVEVGPQSIHKIYSPDGRPDVIPVRSEKAPSRRIETLSKQCQTVGFGKFISTDSPQFEDGVSTRSARVSKTMEPEELRSFQSGSKVLPLFCGTSKRWKAGETQISRSTAKTTTGTMNPVICGSRLGRNRIQTSEEPAGSSTRVGKCPLRNSGESTHPAICLRGPFTGRSWPVALRSRSSQNKPVAKVLTYDVLNCGPRNRFTVRSGNTVLIVHNCGYGMGGKKFALSCKLTAGVVISRKFAKHVVRAYRDKYVKIPALWRDLNTACIRTIQTGLPHHVGRLTARMEGDYMTIELPSGRRLHYRDASIVEVVAPWTQGFVGELFGPEALTEQLEELDVTFPEYDAERQAWTEVFVPKDSLNAVRSLPIRSKLEKAEEQKIPQIEFWGVIGTTKKWGKKRTYGGSLCLAEGTEVLTDSGWKRIEHVRLTDLVFDGDAWVRHDGLVDQGVREVTDCWGVLMTPDHQVLTVEGWKRASQSKGHDRQEVRIPDGVAVSRREREENGLGGSVCLRKDHAETVLRRLSEERHGIKVLRVSGPEDSFREADYSRDESPSCVCRLAFDAGEVREREPSGIQELWSPRNHGSSILADLREVLGGHGTDLSTGAYPGPEEQRQGVFKTKLPLGGLLRAGSQPSGQSDCQREDLGGMVRSDRGQADDALLPHVPRMASGATFRRTYDLTNAGPQHRFVVRGRDGRPFISHNCENVVQAIARDFLAEAMLRIEAAKYRIIATIHDEIVAEVPHGFGSLAEFERIMSQVPRWGSGCPIAVEGFESERYRK